MSRDEGPMDEGPGALRRVVIAYVRREDLVRFDLAVGVAAGLGAGYMGIWEPAAAMRAAPVAAGMVGVLIGATIAAIGLVFAFIDQSLLLKFEMVGESPHRPLAPFLFTVVLAVIAALGVGLVVAVGPNGPPWVLGPVAAIGFGAAAWAVTSLVPALDVLVQFIGVQREASLVTEDDIARWREQHDSDADDSEIDDGR